MAGPLDTGPDFSIWKLKWPYVFMDAPRPLIDGEPVCGHGVPQAKKSNVPGRDVRAAHVRFSSHNPVGDCNTHVSQGTKHGAQAAPEVLAAIGPVGRNGLGRKVVFGCVRNETFGGHQPDDDANSECAAAEAKTVNIRTGRIIPAEKFIKVEDVAF